MNAITQHDAPQEAEISSQEIAALVEKLCNAGHAVHAGRSGDFTVNRWGYSRHCLDAFSLRDFACQLGVL